MGDRVRGSRLVVAVLVGLCALSSGAAFAQQGESSPAGDPGQAGEPGAEIAAERTASSKTFRLPDGQLETRIYESPVSYPVAGRGWKPIGENLREVEGARLENGANDFDVSLPKQIDSAPARVTVGGQWVASELISSEAEPVELEGKIASYGGSNARVSFDYSGLADGLKEDIEIGGSSQPSTFSFDLSASHGLTPSLEEGGAVVFRDQAHHVVAMLPAPTMSDGAAESRAVHYELGEEREAHWRLTVRADREWLEQPQRSFPVTIDPTITTGPPYGCVIGGHKGETGWIDCSSWGRETFLTGYTPALSSAEDNWWRTLMNFETGAIPSTALVSSAAFHIRSTETAQNTKGVELREVTKPWTWQASWSRYDGPEHLWATEGGDYSELLGEVLTSKRGNLAGWWEFSLPTKTVEEEATEGKDLPAIMKLIDDKVRECGKKSCTNRQITFDSSAAKTEANRPYLSVTYTVPSSEAPVASYSFNEGSGETTHDASGKGHEGTLHGAKWTKEGKYGGAIYFDGKEDLVTVPASRELNFSPAFTLEAWVKPDEANKWSAVFTKETPSFVSYQLHAEAAHEAPAGFVFDNEEEESTVEGSGPISPKAWSYLALASDGEHLRLYVNGELAGTSSVVAAAGGKGPLQIGGDLPWEEDSFKGVIDNLRLYNRNLSAEEIKKDQGRAVGASAPSVSTKAASGTGVAKATLNGAVNPHGATTAYQFEYGTTTAYGQVAPASPKEIGSSTEEEAVGEAIGGLKPGTTYHFRLSATNEAGTATGEDRTLTTLALPTALTQSATAVKSEKATLNGTSNPEGFATAYRFEYGPTTSYGTNVPVPDKSIGSGSEDVKVSEAISGLKTGTSYHFRLVATNAEGSSYGSDRTLTTPTSEAPIASYAFDDGGGETAEDYAAEHDATLEGAVWGEGKYGPGLEFDGKESCLRIPTAAVLELRNDFTIEAWVRPQKSAKSMPLIFKEASTGYSYALYAGASESGKAQGFVAENSESASKVASPASLPSAAWSHVALTSDGGTLRLYVGGELVDSTTTGAAEESKGDLRIGCSQNLAQHFEGRIDEVRLYSRALSGEEIKHDRETSIGEAQTSTLPTTIEHTRTLTAAGGPYTGSSVTVPKGVTLHVQPGAAVHLSGTLTVNGTLDASGTKASPALFTSKAEKGPGEWNGIVFNAGSNASQLNHAVINDATTGVSIWENAAPTVSSSTIESSSSYGMQISGSPVISGNSFVNNVHGIYTIGGAPNIAGNTIKGCAAEQYAIYQEISSGATGHVNIHGNLIEGCGSTKAQATYFDHAAIAVTGGAWYYGTTVYGESLGENTVRNGGRAIDYLVDSFNGAIPPDISENTIEKNKFDILTVSGQVAKSATWKDHGYPIVAGNLSVASEASLTLDKGIVLKAEEAATMSVAGEVIAEGTAEQPVLLTSVRDDSVDGDTNGDGSSTKPARGDWIGVHFEAGTSSAAPGRGVLDYMTLRYGGEGASCGLCGGGGPMLSFAGPQAKGPTSGPSELNHAVLEESERTALVSSGASPIVASSRFENVPTAMEFTNGSPEVTGNTIKNCDPGSAAIYQYVQSGTGAVSITGNVVEGCGVAGLGESPVAATAAIEVRGNASYNGATVEGKALSGNTVVGASKPISYYVDRTNSSIPPDITENTLSENEVDALYVAGRVEESTAWTNHGFVIVPEGGYDIAVAPKAALTLNPGLVLKLHQENASIEVEGELIAQGTASEPIAVTSLRDDTIGGDTNGDGSASAPAPGDWRSIDFLAGTTTQAPGRGTLEHVVARYGGWMGSCGICGGGGPMLSFSAGVEGGPTSKASLVRESRLEYAQDPAVFFNGDFLVGEPPKVEWNKFAHNETAINKSGSHTIVAPHNDYSSFSGPRPKGSGDGVGEKIDPEPWQDPATKDGKCHGEKSHCKKGADPVSLATGQLDYVHVDLSLTNRSDMPLEFVRSYDSEGNIDTGMGPGWSQSGLLSASEMPSGDVLVHYGEGHEDLFVKEGESYARPPGITDSLVLTEAGTFTLTTAQQTVYAFDKTGRIATITDDHGLKTTYAYNAEGRLSTITDPSSQTLTFAYNASNHITSVKDSTGREVKFGYSSAGDLETVTDALAGVTKYAYDASHRLTSITDPRKNAILKNVYDAQGRIVEQKDGLEDLWKLKYSEGETLVTEPGGGKITYGFDGEDRVVSETDQLGNKTKTAYDAAGNVKEVLRPGSAKWIFGHDVAGNLTSVKDPEGGERKYEYDAQNRPVKFTDARGDAWSYEWSKAGDLTKIVDPEKGETTFTYNESGQPLTKTDPNKHKTEFTYDSRGNELSTTDPLSHKTSFEYDSRNYLTSKTAPGLKAESFERDAFGEMLSRTTPEGNKTKYAYDANGLPTQITDPGENVWKIERNAMERPTAYIDPLEQQIKVSYNGDLKPAKVVNRRGKETTYGYDLANQLTEVDLPEGGDWRYGYDSRGNRSSVIDPREHETTYEYDLLDRMTEADEPLSTTTKYGYDANGDITAVTDPRGNSTSYAYDKLGRLAEVAQPLKKTTTYSYDAAGNQLARTTAAGTLEYGYDAANRLAEVHAGKTTLRSFGYDAADRRTSAVDATGHKIEIGYNEDGLVSSIDDGRGQSLTRAYNSRGELTKQVDGRGTLEYGYDKLGRLTSLTDPQSKALSFGYDPEGDLSEVKRPNGVTTTSVYNDAGRLAETTSKEEPSTVLEALKYGYDPAGNVTSKLDARLKQETTFSYDALNRITEFNPPGEGSTAYGYDEAGNRTKAGATTYAYNALNQLTSASDGTTYTYDGAGRMTKKENGSKKTSYEWDPFDHLAKAESPTETASYAYDGMERLSERKSGSATQITHYGDLTDLPAYDANGEGKTTTSYVQGAHGLAEQRSGEATSYPLADGHGDITAITGPTGGVESRQEFGPWGEQLSGPSLEMGYLGAWERPADSATGLIQMGARTYDPSLGSFASEDPVLGRMGFGASVNRYLYVWDNPLNAYDLNGLEFCVPTPFGRACAGEAAEDVGSAAESAWNEVQEVGNYIGTGAEEAWKFTAPGRHLLGRRAQDFVKQIDFSTNEFIADTATTLIGYGICAAATAGATAVGTPVAGAAAAATCLTSDAVSFGSVVTDIFDKDNSLWTDGVAR